MDSNMKVHARAIEHGPAGIPFVLEGHSPLCIDVDIVSSEPIPADAELILTAHEIFSGQTKVLPGAAPDLTDAAGDGLRLRIPPEAFKLEAGTWHVLLDVMCGEESLAGTHAGSTAIYVRRADESPEYALGCHGLGYSEFAFDREYGVYFAAYGERLPTSIDPFSDEDAAAFRRDFAKDDQLSAETVHHAGLGFLLAAHAFHATGDAERVRYCHEALARLVRIVAELMMAEDGRLHTLTGVDQKRAHGAHDRAGDALALKFLSQVYFYFRYGPPEEKDYSRYALGAAKEIFRYQLAQPLGPGCAGNCRANDGRVLTGLAWYCLAHKAEHGQFFSPDAENALISFASQSIRELLASDGWYDEGCLEENGRHAWRGNIELALGLIPVHRMIVQLSERGHEEAESAESHVREGIAAALRFVTHPTASLAHVTPILPSSLPSWSRGMVYEVCAEYLDRFDDDASVRQFMNNLAADVGVQKTGELAGLSELGALIHLSDECHREESFGIPPWRQ